MWAGARRSILLLGARLEGALEQGAIVTVHISFRVVDELPFRFVENDSFSSRRTVLTSPCQRACWPASGRGRDFPRRPG
jgi:hypothetical protein